MRVVRKKSSRRESTSSLNPSPHRYEKAKLALHVGRDSNRAKSIKICNEIISDKEVNIWQMAWAHALLAEMIPQEAEQHLDKMHDYCLIMEYDPAGKSHEQLAKAFNDLEIYLRKRI